MDELTDETLARRKAAIRADALAVRRAQPNKAAASGEVLNRFFALPQYAQARTVLMYVHAYSEVRTQAALPRVWADGKTLAVPYCVDGSLELFHLESLDELAPGTFDILEPRAELRDLPGKRIPPEQLNLLAIPGVAFDRAGTRLGYGHGHFDRLLPQCRPDSVKAALAYECQIVDNLPVGPHDVAMDCVVTEKQIMAARSVREG